MSTAVLELRNLKAGYGKKEILNDLSLTLAPGTTTGLLGRNGAGKSTLIHVALGLMRAEKGTANLFGGAAWNAPASTRQRMGFVPQSFEAYEWMSPRDCISLVASCYDRWRYDLVDELFAQWLPDNHSPIGKLSPGQQQRVAILLAIGHQPELLVMDEPVASMDPAARREFFSTLAAWPDSDKQTTLISSHITSDLERICTHIAIINNGRVVLHAALDELKDEVRMYGTPKRAPLRSPDILASTPNNIWVRQGEFANQLPDSGAALVLEDFFLALTS